MINLNNIPLEIKLIPNWIGWKMEEGKDGKLTKIPYNCKTGGRAMSNNPATWTSFNNAIKGMTKYKFDGLGFVFNDQGIVGIDIDHCITVDKCVGNNGELNEIASEIVNSMQSYTEYSQSRNGIHIICQGSLPPGRRRKGQVEMYETGRFFAITGDVIGNYKIENRQQQLEYIHAKFLFENQTHRDTHTFPCSLYLSDNEIIDVIKKSKQADLFNDLMSGSWQHKYNSQSDADQALCNILAFYSGNDNTIIDRIFRSSALYRKKWDRPGYGSRTIQRACNSSGYDPNHNRSRKKRDIPNYSDAFDALVKGLE